jgi:hypothetical protein
MLSSLNYLDGLTMSIIGLLYVPISPGHYRFSLHSHDIFQLPAGTCI